MTPSSSDEPLAHSPCRPPERRLSAFDTARRCSRPRCDSSRRNSFGGAARGHRIGRQHGGAQLDFQRAALGDLHACCRAVPARRRTARPSPPGSSGTAPPNSAAARLASASSAPSWMQTRASCASNSARAQESHVVGRDRRHAVRRAPVRSTASQYACSPARPVRCTSR